MDKQLIFREKYVQRLKELVKDGSILNNYKTNEFIFDKKETLMMPNILRPKGLIDKLNVKNDLETAINLYEAYAGLAPLQASDERLWCFLTHVELYPYMIKRWSSVYEGKAIDQKQYILDRWFLNSSNQSDLIRHPLAGLWWAVHLSVTESATDKYELTRILFRQLDFTTRTLGAYKLGRHKEAIIGILEFIKDSPALFSTSFEGRTRFITKYLNGLGGVKPLAYYDRKFFKDELSKISATISLQVDN